MVLQQIVLLSISCIHSSLNVLLLGVQYITNSEEVCIRVTLHEGEKFPLSACLFVFYTELYLFRSYAIHVTKSAALGTMTMHSFDFISRHLKNTDGPEYP